MLCELIQQLELETKYPNIQSFKHGSNWLFSKIKNNLYVLNNKCFNFFRHVFFLEELILHFFRFVFTFNMKRHRDSGHSDRSRRKKKEEEDTSQAAPHERFPHATTSSSSKPQINFV